MASMVPGERKEIVNIIAHTVLDGLAIGAVVALMCLDKIPTEWGLAIICLIVGIWGKMQSGSIKAPPSGLVVGLASMAAPLFRILK